MQHVMQKTLTVPFPPPPPPPPLLMISRYSLIVSGCAHFHPQNPCMIGAHTVINPTLVVCPKTTLCAVCHIPSYCPLPTLGQPYTITCINDAMLHNAMHTLLKKHHVGHINLVHCPTYGELPFIQELDLAKIISKGKECSVDTGTAQFWKTMLILSGYFDCYANREEKDDPLRNVSLFHDSFEF